MAGEDFIKHQNFLGPFVPSCIKLGSALQSIREADRDHIAESWWTTVTYQPGPFLPTSYRHPGQVLCLGLPSLPERGHPGH